MPGVPVPWPTNALPGRRPGESQGDLINAYAVKVGEQLLIRRTPGLKRYIQIDDAPGEPRGMFATQNRLYYLYNQSLRWKNTFGTEDVVSGLVPGSGPVTFAVNLRPDGPQLVLVTGDGSGAFEVDENGNVLNPYPEAKLPNVTSVEYYAGYFFFVSPTNDMWASDLQNVVFPTTGESTAKAEYSTDPLLRLKMDGAVLLAMGTRTIEVWTDVGASPFPLSRQTTIDTGLLAPWCVAGGSNRWGNGIFFVANDFTVRSLAGTDPRVISNDDVAHDIWTYRGNPDAIWAQVYDFEQQGVFTITTPDWTWEFNLTTNVWHRRDSYGLKCWRGVWATNWQNRWYVMDTKHQRIQEIMVNVYEEDGERLRYRVESAPLQQFPKATRLPNIDVDMTNALGWQNVPSPYQTNPAAMFSWSKDGGATWGRPVARSFGRIGRYAQKITLNGLGRSTSHGLRIRCDVVDPVPAVLRSAVAQRAKFSRARQVEA
jgi:hypothetical protein